MVHQPLGILEWVRLLGQLRVLRLAEDDVIRAGRCVAHGGHVLVVADGAALTEPGADESRQPRISRLPLSGSSLKRVNLVLQYFKTLDEFEVHLLRGELGWHLTRRQLGLPCCLSSSCRFPVGLIDSKTGSLEGLPFLAVRVR